jgi:hypothetical protein
MVFSSTTSGRTFLPQTSHLFKPHHRYVYRAFFPLRAATARSVPKPTHNRGFAITLGRTPLYK